MIADNLIYIYIYTIALNNLIVTVHLGVTRDKNERNTN